MHQKSLYYIRGVHNIDVEAAGEQAKNVSICFLCRIALGDNSFQHEANRRCIDFFFR